MPDAETDPKLLATSVYVRLPPIATFVEDTVFWIARSTAGVAVAVRVAVLVFVGPGVPVGPVVLVGAMVGVAVAQPV